MLTTDTPLLPEEEPFKLDGEAFDDEQKKEDIRQEVNKTNITVSMLIRK